MRQTMLCSLAALTVASLSACNNQEEFREIRDGQRALMSKLADLEKKVDQVASRPAAAAPGQADPNRVHNIPAGNSPYKGPADAPVLMAEFSDFQCPFCAKIPGLVDEVLKSYPKEVKFVFKQYPLQMHQNALNASRASLAAHKQGKFWELHDKMFANQGALDVENLKKYASELGLDMAKFTADMATSEIQGQIDDEMKLAQTVQVTGTPTLFINGKRVTDRSPEGLKRMIDEALKAKS